MRILCTGDLHIGRRPSRLPASADAAEHSCAAAWRAIVETAIAQRVDLVAISGDLVDRENSYFEAADPLEAGLCRLAAHGIPTVAVAGNHDHDVLPRIADRMDVGHFHLLGRGGNWERRTLALASGTIHVDGWSFPRSTVTRSPLPDYDPPAAEGVPVLGLLHADLGKSVSRYAPVSAAELRDAACAFWLLGHVHVGGLLDDGIGAPILYPGSPQPMDPGEPGWHGAWMVHLSPGQRPRAERVPVATVRYDGVRVALDGIADPDQIEPRTLAALSEHLDALLDAGDAPRWLSCRVRVEGRCALRAEAAERLEPLVGCAVIERGGSSLYVERVSIELRPILDLDEMARGSDAPALLARLLRALDAGRLDDDQERLLRAACGMAMDVCGLRHYRSLPVQPEDEQSLWMSHAMRRQADALLESLLATRTGA